MKRSSALRITCALLLTFAGAFGISAQQAEVVRNVNLRPTASTERDPKRLLTPPDTVTLMQASQSLGYYHVRTRLNETGWVWSRNVRVLLNDTVAVAESNPGGPPLPPPGSYATSNASCPAVGTHNLGGVATPYDDTTDAALRNRAKRHIPNSAQPVTLTLANFRALQRDVDVRFTDAHLSKTSFHPDRGALMNRTIAGMTIGEGNLVQFSGFLLAVRPQGNESVNCAGLDGNDIHLSVGAKNGSEWGGVVVEMIPQLPHVDGWDDSTLRKVARAKLRVLVVGGLTYDNEHLVNDDSLRPKNGQPKRISLWEIHPITAFFVCEVTTCDPANHDAWTTLKAWASRP